MAKKVSGGSKVVACELVTHHSWTYHTLLTLLTLLNYNTHNLCGGFNDGSDWIVFLGVCDIARTHALCVRVCARRKESCTCGDEGGDEGATGGGGCGGGDYDDERWCKVVSDAVDGSDDV